MPVKLADLVKKESDDERWFSWKPEEAASPTLQLLIRVVLPRRFIAIRNRHTKKVFSRRASGFMEKTNDEAAAEEILRYAVRDWKGVTIGVIQELTLTNPVELGPETKVECTPENVQELTEAVPELGAWIVETAANVRLFNRPTKEEEIQNLT